MERLAITLLIACSAGIVVLGHGIAWAEDCVGLVGGRGWVAQGGEKYIYNRPQRYSMVIYESSLSPKPD